MGLEIEAPPANSTFEEFPQLSLHEATVTLRAVRHPKAQNFPEERGDVPLSAYSEADQRRMLMGELPKSYPEHPWV